MNSVSSEAPHIFQAVLLEDGGEVGFGHIISEGAVAEDDGAFAGGGLGFVPGRNAEGERLDFLGGDGFGQAHEQRARADAVDLLASDGVRFNGHGEVEAEF